MTKDKEIASFISYLRNERRYSEKTVTAYHTDLAEVKNFLVDNGGFSSWRDVKTRDLEIYLQDLSQRNLARTSQLRKISSLRSFYRFLTKRKLVKIDPTQTIVLRKKDKKLPQFLYEPEIKQVFDTLQRNDPLTLRNLALLSLFYTTGMRVSEVSSLLLEQVNFSLQTILVHGKGKKDRYVFFDQKTKAALTNYLADSRPELLKNQEDQNYFFLNNRGLPITSRGIEYIIRKIFKQAGVSGNVHPHELRHTFATAMLNNGADLRTVQELLGHSNLSTTQIYTHVTMTHLQNDYDKFFSRNEKKNEAKK